MFIVLFNYVAFRGMKTGSVMLVAFALITLVAVFGIMIPGFIDFNPANFTGWLSHSSFSGLDFSFLSFVGGFSVIMVTLFFIAST